jgi:hypothetical protein
VNAATDDRIARVGRRREAPGVGQLSAEVQPADECEEIAEGRAALGAQFLGKQRARARRQNLLCPTPLTIGW